MLFKYSKDKDDQHTKTCERYLSQWQWNLHTTKWIGYIGLFHSNSSTNDAETIVRWLCVEWTSKWWTTNNKSKCWNKRSLGEIHKPKQFLVVPLKKSSALQLHQSYGHSIRCMYNCMSSNNPSSIWEHKDQTQEIKRISPNHWSYKT